MEETNRVKELISNFETSKEDKYIKNTPIEEIKEYSDLIEEKEQLDIAKKDIEAKIKEYDKENNLKLERLEEELSEVDYVAEGSGVVNEYKKRISDIKQPRETMVNQREEIIKQIEENLQKQKEVNKRMDEARKEKEKQNQPEIDKEVKELEEEYRRNLNSEIRNIDKKLEVLQINLEIYSFKIRNFNHEMGDGIVIDVRDDKGDLVSKAIEVEKEESEKEFRDLQDKYNETIDQISELKEAKKLCEGELQKFKDRETKEAEKFAKAWNDAKRQENGIGKSEKAQEQQEAPEETQEQGNQETSGETQGKGEQETSEGTQEQIKGEQTEQETESPVMSDAAKRVQDLGDKIIDDMAQDYKNIDFIPEPIDEKYVEKQNIDYNKIEKNNKDISILISEAEGIVEYIDNQGKQLKLPLTTILDEKKASYKRIGINKMCREVAGGRIRGALLRRKVNPEIVKILDSTGNNEMLKDYIKNISDKKEFSFNLTHDLTNLTRVQKWMMQRYTRAEEKCGAKIIGKLWDKNKALPESSKQENKEDKILKEAREEISGRVNEILNRREQSKSNSRNKFVQGLQAEGKNEEVAEKFRDSDKKNERPIDELINALDVSESSKFHIADYTNQFGEEAARKRFEKTFAQAKAKLDMRDFVEKSKEENLPGNQQMKQASEKDDETR